MSRQMSCLKWLAPVFVLLMLSQSAPRADSFWMTTAEIRAFLAGTTIDGDYVDGRTFTESYDLEGRLKYHEPADNRNWTGDWSVTNDRFCTIYDVSGTGGCFRVRRISFNCLEFFFDTRTEEEARSSTPRNPSWTARAWRTDKPSTCAERPLV